MASLFLVDDGAAINVASTMVSWLRLVSIEQTLLLAPRLIRSTQEGRDRRFWKLFSPLAMERPTVLEQVRFQRRGAVLTQHRDQPTLLRSTSHEDRSVHQSLDWSWLRRADGVEVEVALAGLVPLRLLGAGG